MDRVPSLDITDADIPTPRHKGIAAIRHNRNTITAATHRRGPTIRLRPADIPRRDLMLRRIILRPAAVIVPRRVLIVAEVAVVTAVHVVVIQVAAVPTVAAPAVAEDHADLVAAVDRTGVQVAAATAAVTTKSQPSTLC